MPAEADPELARRLAAAAQTIYAEASDEMLEKVARRLARGIEEPGWAEAKLADVGRLRAETAKTLAGLEGKAGGTISKAITEAFTRGAEAAQVEVGGQLYGRSSGRTLDALVREAVTGVTQTHDGILRNVADNYRQIIAGATTRIAVGTESRREATSRALAEFARRGITGFEDRAGRKWEIETYAEMATRTATGRAQVAGSLDRFSDRGIDVVIVSNAPEECSTCRPWEGKVLSISGTSQGRLDDGVEIAGTVAEARAAGLLHSNCRHRLGAYIPGLTPVPTNTSDPKGDEERQRQRALERQVRAAKRNVNTQKAFVAEMRKENGSVPPEALARLRAAESTQKAASARLGQFVADNDRKRLQYREGARGKIDTTPKPVKPLSPPPAKAPPAQAPPAPPRPAEPVSLSDLAKAKLGKSNITPEALADLKPVATFTKTGSLSRRKKMKAQPGGEELVETLTDWQDGETKETRKLIEKYLTDKKLTKKQERKVTTLLDAIDQSPHPVPAKLYRGLVFDGDPKDVAASMPVGNVLDWNVSGFSASRAISSEFAKPNKTKGQTSVMIEWDEGLKSPGFNDRRALPIQNLSEIDRYHKEQEWLAGGRFYINEVRQSGNKVTLRVSQIRSLGH